MNPLDYIFSYNKLLDNPLFYQLLKRICNSIIDKQ
jgi:hypothetical protein